MPGGYGIASGHDAQVEWAWVEAQCVASRNYWVCTTRADGRPHAMPVWGLWLDRRVVFSTDPQSVKARNFLARPEVVVHLESGDEVVVVEGRVEAMETSLLPEFLDAYETKYDYRPSGEQVDGVYQVRPRKALAWRETDFPTSATRFTLDG
jgi:pyridoxine/pyridoxamine 5'-phosphate oxidase